ncbi:MAG: hypothetical protein M1828_004345 [Chrysothrix sp. TS-e1954]|nr:MAG: hypothetical protein M1828_004345 [Chrysothrix sp. TS-e1954]
MSSHLRNQTLFEPIAAQSTQARYPTVSAQPPQKKQRMSITQTYFLAHTARGKLASAAAEADHDLRLLVGHANLLDTLTVELQDAEREQDAWFNETVRASRKQEEPRRVQWKDNVAIQSESEDFEIPDASDSDSDTDSDDSDDIYEGEQDDAFEMMLPARRVKSPQPKIQLLEGEDQGLFAIDDEEDEEELASLTLTRTRSHSSHPPELIHDTSDDSDDDMSPVSPPPALDFSQSQTQEFKSHDFALAQSKKPIEAPLLDHSFFVDESRSPIIAAC